MSDLLKHLEHLSPEKRELVLKKLRQQTSSVTSSEENSGWMIQPASRDGKIPLSFSQTRLWFLNQLEGATATYNIPAALQLKGDLNISALEQAIREIVRRHEILRTYFQLQDSEPVQIIDPDSTLALSVIDLQSLSEKEQILEVERILHQEAEYSFNLTTGPLLRVVLLQLEQTSFVLSVNMHHIISDGWSMQVFTGELSQLYQAFNHSQPSPLPELFIQYADYTCWQRQWLNTEVLEHQLKYWKQQLAGIPNLLELPTDFPRPSIKTFRGKNLKFVLKPGLKEKLEQLSQKSGTTLFMTLLAAFAVLLFRYSSQEDIVIGSPIANRNRTEIEGLIGFFVNTLVLRSDLSGNPTFDELLQKVKQTTLAAYTYQDLPFEKLVEYLQPERNLSYTPLFQVLFTLQNTPTANLSFDGLRITLLEVENITTKFDLSLGMEETPNGLTGIWEYNTDLFKDSTVERMNGHFQTLLESVVNHPEEKIAYLPLLTPQEQHLLLGEWNQNERNYDLSRCLHHWIEAQVQRTPEAIAVKFEEQTLTYEALNHRSNQLAHYLQELGVNCEVLVGICLERSLEMVIGLLAILKAGGAYVPLDPGYPQARLADMLEDSQVSILLTQEKLIKQLSETPARKICLDQDWPRLSHYATENPKSAVTPNNLAYVIYTSGSTGKPKGVMNIHRGIVNRLLWMQETYGLTPEERVLQKTPFSFDVSVWEFFWTLMSGACLVIAKPEGHKDSTYLVNLIVKEQITTVHFVPSMLQVFLQDRAVNQCTSLKRVICSGEALPLALQERFFQVLSCELHNLYGPTEAAIDVTFWRCQRDTHLHTVPIGRPVANTQMYILDKYLQPVPIGVAGELHIGGVQVARGYLNRQELTAEKFIPNPFSVDSSQHLYKTGDLTVYLPDGAIEYLGRIDHQVKIRGFRLELGEIEALLNTHSEVRESLVIVREEKAGEKQLVAYIVSNFIPERFPYQSDCVVEVEGQKLTLKTHDISQNGLGLSGQGLKANQEILIHLNLPVEPSKISINAKVIWTQEQHIGVEFIKEKKQQESLLKALKNLQNNSDFGRVWQRMVAGNIQNYLKQKLPAYMIPSAFVMLDSFPLTPNGKIDRKALPVPSRLRPELTSAFRKPSNDIEQFIVTIWQEVLRLDQVGIDDNFFDLGGHSLLMVQVQQKLKSMFPEPPSIIQLFQYPTIQSLANYLKTLISQREEPERQPQRISRQQAIIQQRQLRQQHRSSNPLSRNAHD